MNDFDTINMNKAQKAAYYLKEYGFSYTRNRALKKLGIPIADETEYMLWLRKKRPKKGELARQKERIFPSMPVFDVVIDATPGLLFGSGKKQYKTDGDSQILRKSIKKQSYVGVGKIFESGKDSFVEKFPLQDVLEEGKGDWVVFAEANTVLEPQAFYEVVRFLQKHSEVELLYVDEDCGTKDGKHRLKPYFKPDAAPELLYTHQYYGGVFFAKRALLEKVSDQEIKLFGDHWYDLALTLTEEILKRNPGVLLGTLPTTDGDISKVSPAEIGHLPKVLFTNFVEKEFDGFYRALFLEEYLSLEKHVRTNRPGTKVFRQQVEGFFRLENPLPEKRPLVSVLIPSKDHTDDLDRCIQSLVKQTEYPEFEVVVVENNSTEKETFAYYEKITGQTYDAETTLKGTLAGGQTIKIVTWKEGFNFSGINNFGAKFAEGELLLLLNNDTKLRSSNALSELVRSVLLPGVGAAGSMLYYEDGTIQHGGVVYKIGGFAANALWSLSDRDEKYFPYSITAREMSCCTAACLILRKEAFDAVEGFDETLCVALNDVDLCLKVRKAGYKVIFNPASKLYHYESKSRGMETTSEKQARFNREINYFQEKWQRELDLGDPYYNVNQTLHYANYSIELAEDNRGRYKA